MGILGGYHSVGGCYWRHHHFIRRVCTSILPRYALPIHHPHYSLISESAKSISFAQGFIACSLDIPGGTNSLLLRWACLLTFMGPVLIVLITECGKLYPLYLVLCWRDQATLLRSIPCFVNLTPSVNYPARLQYNSWTTGHYKGSNHISTRNNMGKSFATAGNRGAVSYLWRHYHHTNKTDQCIVLADLSSII